MFVVICHEFGVLVTIACSWFVSSWLLGKASYLVRRKIKSQNKTAIEGTLSSERKRTHSKWRITCSTPLLYHLFCAQLFFFYIYVFVHALIFHQPKTTFQTVENKFPDQASIFRQLTFFTLHRIYLTLQQWTGKCQCRALQCTCTFNIS